MLEHVRSTARPLAAMQRALSPLNERAIGCHLDRDTFGLARSLGFSIDETRSRLLIRSGWWWRVHQPAPCYPRLMRNPGNQFALTPCPRTPEGTPPGTRPSSRVRGVWRRASVFRYASSTRRLTLDQGRVFPGGIDDGKGVEGVEGVKGVELLRHRGEVNLCRREPSPPA